MSDSLSSADRDARIATAVSEDRALVDAYGESVEQAMIASTRSGATYKKFAAARGRCRDELVSALRSRAREVEELAEIRRQRNAWRDYAEHLDHCRECSEMGPIGDCFERKELQEATKCQRCGGSARLLPDVECPICAEPRR